MWKAKLGFIQWALWVPEEDAHEASADRIPSGVALTFVTSESIRLWKTAVMWTAESWS